MGHLKTLQRAVGILSLLGGISILVYTLLPILDYEIKARARFVTYLSPLKEGQNSFVLGEEKEENLVDSPVDYTDANNWFAAVNLDANHKTKIRYYTMSIPKLRIKDATVSIGGEDLSENLIQYPGTALPGKDGNGVIFGHSILPRFYNPEDPISIFSLLPTLDPGDKIEVVFDGITYNYEVEDMFEVRPTDTYILEQNETEPYLSLVTCTPPGDPRRPKRLVVRAKIVDEPTLSFKTQ